MNDNMMVVSYDPFALESRLFITKKGKVIGSTYSKSELDELANTLIENAYKHDIWNIYARAPQAYYDELWDRVHMLENTLYNENKIQMEQR